MINNLNKLFNSLNLHFKNNNFYNLKHIIKNYSGNDWNNYVKFSNNNYFKNTIYKNKDLELVIISWNINQFTNFHNHPDNGCFLKVLDGQLVEQTIKNNVSYANLLNKNSIGFQKGKDGIHKITSLQKSVSLHIYSPSQ